MKYSRVFFIFFIRSSLIISYFAAFKWAKRINMRSPYQKERSLGRDEKKVESVKSLLTNRINFPNRKLFTRARLQIENFLPGRVLAPFLAHSKTEQRIRSVHVEG